MELMVASALGILVACAVFLILRARTFPVIIGISLLGYGVNFFLFTMGRLTTDAPPLLKDGMTNSADPLPQALVLTAIVIGFAMTGFIVELALRARHETSSDHVDAGRGVPGVGRIAREEPNRTPEFDADGHDASGGGR
ncbi:MAG: Na+/H+ antiporter subunit C [Burkholderiaceae bacterium]